MFPTLCISIPSVVMPTLSSAQDQTPYTIHQTSTYTQTCVHMHAHMHACTYTHTHTHHMDSSTSLTHGRLVTTAMLMEAHQFTHIHTYMHETKKSLLLATTHDDGVCTTAGACSTWVVPNPPLHHIGNVLESRGIPLQLVVAERNVVGQLCAKKRTAASSHLPSPPLPTLIRR